MGDDGNSNQQRILDSARSLFLKKGYNGSNLRDIARAARVSMGGIYHHFSSKEEIYLTLLKESDVADDMVEILNLFRAPEFPENLARVGRAIAHMARKHRDSFKLFYIDVLEFEGKNVRPIIQSFRDGFDPIAKALLAHRDDIAPAIHPTLALRMMVDMFMYSSLEAVMLDLDLAQGYGLAEDTFAEQMAEALLRGLLRRDPA